MVCQSTATKQLSNVPCVSALTHTVGILNYREWWYQRFVGENKKAKLHPSSQDQATQEPIDTGSILTLLPFCFPESVEKELYPENQDPCVLATLCNLELHHLSHLCPVPPAAECPHMPCLSHSKKRAEEKTRWELSCMKKTWAMAIKEITCY